MKVNRTRIAAAAFAFIVAFLFLAPVVNYGIPAGVYNCPPRGCDFLRYGSVTYWALGVGGTWRDVTGYSISVPTGSAAVISTSTVSYTSTMATFLYRTMPKNFTVNGYAFHIEYNGTGYTVSQNGVATSNSGFSLVLKVSDGTNNQTVIFGWAPPAPAPLSLPVPDNASLLGGKVELSWLSNSTGTYLYVIAG